MTTLDPRPPGDDIDDLSPEAVRQRVIYLVANRMLELLEGCATEAELLAGNSRSMARWDHCERWDALRGDRPIQTDVTGRRFYVDQWNNHISAWPDTTVNPTALLNHLHALRQEAAARLAELQGRRGDRSEP